MSIESSSTESSPNAEALQLNGVEVRILGCLIEKQATNPETYPLTLNALVIACNQKTSRDPVMNLTQGQVGQSLRALEGRGLTRLVMGSRADRWEHRVDKGLELVPAQVILTGLLLLRGPQTVNELLTRSNRMHDFEDSEQVVHQLERLIARGLAMLVPRQSGQREDRYMHLLGDPESLQELLAARQHTPERPSASPAANSRIDELEARVAALKNDWPDWSTPRSNAPCPTCRLAGSGEGGRLLILLVGRAHPGIEHKLLQCLDRRHFITTHHTLAQATCSLDQRRVGRGSHHIENRFSGVDGLQVKRQLVSLRALHS